MNRMSIVRFAAFAILLPCSSLGAQRAAPTVADARVFMDKVERDLAELSVKDNRAGWVAQTYITDDTGELSAAASNQLAVAVQRYALESRRYDKLSLPPALRRKMTLLRLALSAPPPHDAAEAAELSRLGVALRGDYGKGTYCRARKGSEAPSPNDSSRFCRQFGELARVLATSRDPAELLDAWSGWHSIAPPLKQRYSRFVDLSNKGAHELGFKDAGALWRANYDMPPDDFAKELDRLWAQVRPLYVSLHAYVRNRLVEKYGPTVVSPSGPIPAHLLGNMWAQEWGNIYDIAASKSSASIGYDLTKQLAEHKIDQVGMAHIADQFFQSMGFAALPATFYERSMLVKPRDREVVCHASAWDVDDLEDLRVKACLDPTAEDLVVIHHEEGHNFYQRAYNKQTILFKGGANDGFHEAIGDAIALGITPGYLKTIGLIDEVPSAAADTMLLLRQALDRVAFLPFGLLIDQWRWKVFSGEVTPANYNKAWWDLRLKYQGIVPPVARSEADFDPGAKSHVPGNTPYTRYFLARVLQFQFFRALCKEAGFTGPLYRCTPYGSKTAGAALEKMLAMGASKPWPDALEALTGQRTMDATAMLDYFAPLKTWLDQQNRGKPVGW